MKIKLEEKRTIEIKFEIKKYSTPKTVVRAIDEGLLAEHSAGCLYDLSEIPEGYQVGIVNKYGEVVKIIYGGYRYKEE